MGYLEDEAFLKDGHNQKWADAEHYCSKQNIGWICWKPPVFFYSGYAVKTHSQISIALIKQYGLLAATLRWLHLGCFFLQGCEAESYHWVMLGW